SKTWFIDIEKNPKYFVSAKTIPPKNLRVAQSNRLKPHQELETLPLANRDVFDRLVGIGVSSIVAQNILTQSSREEVEIQLEQLEFLKDSGKIKNPAGFLVEAVKQGYRPPELMTKSKDEKKLEKASRLIEQAKNLARVLRPKELESAIEIAKEAEDLGCRRARSVIEDAQKSLRIINEDIKVELAKKELAGETLDMLSEAAWRKLATDNDVSVAKVKTRPFAEEMWKAVLKGFILERCDTA
ncbi:MAG: hypothetical protein WCO92_06750, partial [Verrucomicrobiota bacterium]